MRCRIIIFTLLIGFVNPLSAQILKKVSDKLEKGLVRKIEERFPPQSTANPQNSDETNPSEGVSAAHNIYFEKGIVFNSPNSNLTSFELQKYNDLPRWGHISLSGFSNQGLNQHVDSETRRTIAAKKKQYQRDYEKYFKLLEMYYLTDAYEVMNLERLTTNIKTGQKELKKSFEAQQHLKGLATILCTDEAHQIYFCNSAYPCKSSNISVGYSNFRQQWGGTRANEFDRNKKYKAFVESNLQDLRTWASSLSREGYIVVVKSLGTYNFESEGFFISHSFNSGGNNLLNTGRVESRFIYSPKKEFENALRNQPGKPPRYSGIFKLSPSEAELLIERTNRQIFLVYKIEMEPFYPLSETTDTPYSSRRRGIYYHLQTPKLELYEDEALTKKIGELNVER